MYAASTLARLHRAAKSHGDFLFAYVVCTNLSYDIEPGSVIIPCIKIDHTLVLCIKYLVTGSALFVMMRKILRNRNLLNKVVN